MTGESEEEMRGEPCVWSELIEDKIEMSEEFISLMINLRPRESTKTRNEADGFKSKRSSSVLPEVKEIWFCKIKFNVG